LWLQLDHICWFVCYHEDLQQLLSNSSCAILRSHGIDPVKFVGFTFIAYTRAVIGSQTNLISNVSMVDCPLFRCFTAELNDELTNKHDVGNLGDNAQCVAFFVELDSLKASFKVNLECLFAPRNHIDSTSDSRK
jgi:hypothetical protein